MSNFNNKLTWNTISGYNAFLPAYVSGDLDIFPMNDMTGTGDIVLRTGNIYTSISSYINSTPIIKLTYLDVNSSIANQFSSISGLYVTKSYVDFSISGYASKNIM